MITGQNKMILTYIKLLSVILDIFDTTGCGSVASIMVVDMYVIALGFLCDLAINTCPFYK